MDKDDSQTPEIPLDELLSDYEALQTCQKVLDCYASDGRPSPLSSQEPVRPSSSFVTRTISGGPKSIKKELEELNHTVSVVDELLSKAALSHSSDIIQSFEEVSEYAEMVGEVTTALDDLNERVGKKYRNLVLLYNAVESDTATLERLRKVYVYSLECRRLMRHLQGLHARAKALQSSVRDFLEMLLIAWECMACLDKVLALERTDALLRAVEYCEDLKNTIVKRVHEDAIMPLFDFRGSQCGLGAEPGRDTEKILVVSHAIYKELSVSSRTMLELIEGLVEDTSAAIDLSEVMDDTHREWEGLFLAQVSEFLSRYARNLRSLYYVCRSARYALGEKLDRSDREVLARYLQKYVHEDPKEPYALCERYVKKSVAALAAALATLDGDGERFDVVMLAPQLIALGDATHAELSNVSIPFNAHRHYFKTICEERARDFVAVASKKITPVAKICFRSCVRSLPAAEPGAAAGSANELGQAALMLMNLPAENEMWLVLREFLEKAKACPALFSQVCAVAAPALDTVFGNVAQIRSRLGNKLTLSDGGSKITLVTPNDAQQLNARLYEYVQTIVLGVEEGLADLVPEESGLLRALDRGRSIPLISAWVDDTAATVWHTVSYVSVENREFSWSCQQVAIACQNVVRILRFLKNSYFDPLVPVGRYHLLAPFAASTVASILAYALTTWPLGDEDKLTLVNATTELEFMLSEILHAKLPRTEREYLSFFRRLIFLSDEELAPALAGASSPLPADVLLLHATCRLVRDNAVAAQLCRALNFTSVHFMLEAFRGSLLAGASRANLEGLRAFLGGLALESPLFAAASAALADP